MILFIFSLFLERVFCGLLKIAKRKSMREFFGKMLVNLINKKNNRKWLIFSVFCITIIRGME